MYAQIIMLYTHSTAKLGVLILVGTSDLHNAMERLHVSFFMELAVIILALESCLAVLYNTCNYVLQSAILAHRLASLSSATQVILTFCNILYGK